MRHYDPDVVCPILYRYANNDPEATDINTVLDILGFDKQDQPCKGDVFCYLLRPDSPITDHPALDAYQVAPEDVPIWMSDVCGGIPHLATLANIRIILRLPEWETVLELP